MSLKDLRLEAKDPATAPQRLRQLANLPGNRGNFSSPAGWCREDVAGNPGCPNDLLEVLALDANDMAVRANVARNPSTLTRTLKILRDDPVAFVAKLAAARLAPQDG